MANLVDKYFGNSYRAVVSAFVEEEKITVEELKELINMVEKGQEK